MQRKLLLKDIWPFKNVLDYKVHFGRSNGEHQPLDLWVDDRSEWQEWQESNVAEVRKACCSPMIMSP